MCAVGATPALHLPDHRLLDIEHLVQLLEFGQVGLAGDAAEQLHHLCHLLEIPDISMEEVKRAEEPEPAEDFVESDEAADPETLQEDMIALAAQVIRNEYYPVIQCKIIIQAELEVGTEAAEAEDVLEQEAEDGGADAKVIVSWMIKEKIV